jgi:transposase
VAVSHVLLSAAGNGTMSIMRAVGKSKPSVWRWQERYLAQGIGGLQRDATRPGRKPPLTAEVIAAVVEKTLRETPPAATHWSTRTMAHAVGLSHTSVKRIWNAHGLKPHLTVSSSRTQPAGYFRCRFALRRPQIEPKAPFFGHDDGSKQWSA